jgi:dephospho-CoA kinase
LDAAADNPDMDKPRRADPAGSRHPPAPDPSPSHPPAVSPSHLPVIGLAGGVGSGKSTVARAFEKLGAIVIDSDAQARQALRQPAVRDELVRWWGPRILDPDGEADRRAIAAIVFGDPAERRRLESLVHPLVKARRAELIERARRAGAVAAVIDAPLLFEAGVDAECDVVVFVDAPRHARLDRVRRTRGWDAAELDRREAAQLPLDEKRGRSAIILRNLGDLQDLETRAAEVFRQILAARSRPPGSP